MARFALGGVVSLATLLWITSFLSPDEYGIFATILAIESTLFRVCQYGMQVHIVRAERLGRGLIVCSIGIPFLLASFAAIVAAVVFPAVALRGIPGSRELLLIVIAILPIRTATAVVSALLERGFRFREVATAELAGQVLFLAAAAVFGSLYGFSARTLVCGWVIQQVVLIPSLILLARYEMRKAWTDEGDLKEDFRRAYSFGLAYSASGILWELRGLGLPLLVTPIVGIGVAGSVALAYRIADFVFIVKGAAYRVALSTLSSIRGERNKVTDVVERASEMQVFAVMPFVALYVVVVPLVGSAVLGDRWAGVIWLVPLAATASVAASVFNVGAAALWVSGKAKEMLLFLLTYIAILFWGALAIQAVSSSFGYVLAEALACASYALLYRATLRLIGGWSVTVPLICAACIQIAMLISPISVWGVIVLAIAFVAPNVRSRGKDAILMAWSAIRKPKES